MISCNVATVITAEISDALITTLLFHDTVGGNNVQESPHQAATSTIMASCATTSFVVPEDAEPTRDFGAEFQRLCTTVNPVNHGEFEDTALALVNPRAPTEPVLWPFNVVDEEGRRSCFMPSPVCWRVTRGIASQRRRRSSSYLSTVSRRTLICARVGSLRCHPVQNCVGTHQSKRQVLHSFQRRPQRLWCCGWLVDRQESYSHRGRVAYDSNHRVPVW
jgi:hypothetical protein